MERPATTHVRCPKCRSRSLNLTEISAAEQTWIVVDGKLDRAEGYCNPGSVESIHGECRRCRHVWRLRALQITDVTTEDADQRPAS